jgi:hypothetical protein
MLKLTTVYFTWSDWIFSAESFKDNSWFYKYINYMKKEDKYPIKLGTKNSDWIWEWCDWPNWERIDIEIIW